MTQTIAEPGSHTGTALDHRSPNLWPTTQELINARGSGFGAKPALALVEVKPSGFVWWTLMARIITALYPLSTLA